MFINGDGNWVDILNDTVTTYNNNIYFNINMAPIDASNNNDKVKNTFNIKNIKPSLKLVIMSAMLTNVTFSLKDTFVIGIENCLTLMKF